MVIIHEENHAWANQFVVGIKKVYIITISENSSGNSCKLKTFSCGNCKKNFAHSQTVIMHEKSFKGKPSCRIYSKSSCKLKTLSCGNCNTNFANSKAMIIPEKNHARSNF